MSRSHLIPTPITRADGVQTTVYRRSDVNGTKASSALAKQHAVSSVPVRDELDEMLGGLVEDETVAGVLRGSKPSQLRNIRDALNIALERDELTGEMDNEQSVHLLIRDGAHSLIQRVVQDYDKVPEGEVIGTHAKKAAAHDLLETILQHDIMNKDDQYVRNQMESSEPQEIEMIQRAMDAAQERDSSGAGRGHRMTQVAESVATGGGYAAVLYGKHADLVPDESTVEEFYYLFRDLLESGCVEGDEDNFPTFEAHVRASEMFEELTRDKNREYLYAENESYETSHSLIRGVEKYHEHVEKLMEYRNTRKTEDFDTDDFRAYLNAGVMSDGML